MYEPLERREFEAQDLVSNHPPMWRDRNKRVVSGIACPTESTHRGTLRYSRWPEWRFPDEVDIASALDRVEGRPGFYDYAPVPGDPGAVEWHVNFADRHLFVAYGSGLFAQDEMQVAEHPALGSLREALLTEGASALTVEDGHPTPVLVAGVERRCRVATNPNAAEGRPEGLYGNAFAWAPEEAVRKATTRLDPPSVSNFIAIAAPTGSGSYTEAQIAHILRTAASGFQAAVTESSRLVTAPSRVVVHTGFWGCGAFGGNRVLMAMLQIMAGGLAGIDRLMFHTGPDGSDALGEARATLAEIGTGTHPTSYLVSEIVELGFSWGVSDGN